MALLVLGMATLVLALLFSVWVREDLREVEMFEQPLLRKAERAGDDVQVQSIKLVFDAQRTKLRSEQRTWLWVLAGSGGACVGGLALAWVAHRTRSSRASQRS